jgi:hypothetical protein
MSIEIYTPERQAEFLLNNSIDTKDYRRALAEVCARCLWTKVLLIAAKSFALGSRFPCGRTLMTTVLP